MSSNLSRKKTIHDLLWNYVSLFIFAISGISINVLIASNYDSSALGVFNQIFALYIMSSQFAVGGVHFSVLKFTSQHDNHTEIIITIINSALLVVFVLSVLIALALFFGKNIIGEILDSPSVSNGIYYIAPSLIFFSFNKVLLSSMNGLRMMRAFAIISGLRYILIISFVFYVCISGLSSELLPASFLFSEIVLLPIQVLLLRRKLITIKCRVGRYWIKEHSIFGFKAFLGGVFIELNSRVDVLMLGIFLSDSVVGLYSFAAMLAEGFHQALVVVKNNINPVMGKLISARKIDEFKRIVVKTMRIVYPVSFLITSLSIGLYLPALHFLPNVAEFSDSLPVLATLLLGFWLVSGFLPFDSILTQSGFPASQTFINAFGLVINFLLNILLIPLYGPIGAALATSASLVFTIICLNKVVSHKLGFSLI